MLRSLKQFIEDILIGGGGFKGPTHAGSPWQVQMVRASLYRDYLYKGRTT